MNQKDVFLSEFESSLYWYASNDRETLAKKIGISKRAVQNLINDYSTQSGNNVRNSKKYNRYLCDDFSPMHITTDPVAYLSYCRSINSLPSVMQIDSSTTTSSAVDDISDLVSPSVDSDVLTCLIRSINTSSQVSAFCDDGRKSPFIMLSPHAVFKTAWQYHVRAYNHSDSQFESLPISLFASAEPASAWGEGISADLDTDWHEFVELSLERKDGLATKLVKIRKAMLPHIKKEIRQSNIWK